MCSWKVYTILCRTTFQSFACTEIDQDESFHQNDFTVDCNSGGYQAYSVVAAIFILIYPIGIVAIFVALLYLNRHTLGEEACGCQHAGKWWSGGLETFDFLVDGYRRGAFWYEIMEFLRCKTARPTLPLPHNRSLTCNLLSSFRNWGLVRME